MKLKYSMLVERYPSLRWQYSVESGFWAKLVHPLYGSANGSDWYVSFPVDSYRQGEALRELDVLVDSVRRPECQGLQVKVKSLNVSHVPPA